MKCSIVAKFKTLFREKLHNRTLQVLFGDDLVVKVDSSFVLIVCSKEVQNKG